MDDNQTNRRILEEVLAELGRCDRLGRRSGPRRSTRSGSAEAARQPFGLALLDGMMPEMDGFELAERIRRDPDVRSSSSSC